MRIRVPLPPALESVWQRRLFRLRPGTFNGVYDDFAAALRSVPSSAAIGYDVPDMAALYQEALDRVFPCDYPIMFWLQPLLANSLRVFDLGGHVGLAYYGYRQYLQFPTNLNWCVCDVAAVVEAGRKLAASRGTPQITFTASWAEASGADVLFASGSLQYIERSLADRLDDLERPPQHLLLNKLPLTDGRAFVTLQNTVYTFNPYHVFNRSAFERALLERGYRIVDRWGDPERSCELPMHREHSVAQYSGMYLVRRD